MVLGENADMAGEAASRGSLDLPGRQEELLKAIVACGKPVVLVLLNGRPLSIVWAAEHVPAILEAWEPGSEGGTAVADILFGDVNPGGKLPVTFPRSGSHEPLYYARTLTHQSEDHPLYRSRYWDSPTTPLYPFGFGLSYTTFSIDNLKVSSSLVKSGPIGDSDSRGNQHGSGCRGRSGPALYSPKGGKRFASHARAEGLRAYYSPAQ